MRKLACPLRLVLAVAASLFLLASCSVSNTGSVNYRKTRIGDAAKPTSSRTSTLSLMNKYSYSPDPSAGIKRDDVVSIFLETAFIKDFWEGPALFSKGEFVTRGEIAIVVRAFEMDSQSKDGKGPDFDFTAEGAKKGRLVYFNPDVRKGQFLNFSYLPVYGPIKYKGKPLGLEINIIEVDSDSQALVPLLSTLAGLGAQAFPPTSAVLGVLDELGSALLKGHHDDHMFCYKMILMPEGGLRGINYPVIEAGHYVFIRREDRRDVENWGMRFDPREGKLVVGSKRGTSAEHTGKDGKQSTWEEQLRNAQARDGLYREETYLVFQIQKGFDELGYDLQQQNNYGEFLTAMDKQANDKPEAVARALVNAANKTTTARTLAELKSLFRAAVIIPETESKVRLNAVNEFVLRLKDSLACQSKAPVKVAGTNGGQTLTLLGSGCITEKELAELSVTMRRAVVDYAAKEAFSVEALKKGGVELANLIMKIPVPPAGKALEEETPGASSEGG